jgi:hypothetical protein
MGRKHREIVACMFIIVMVCAPSMIWGQAQNSSRRTGQSKRSAAKAAPATDSKTDAAEGSTAATDKTAESAAAGSSSPVTVPTSPSNNRKTDLSYITPDTVAAVVAYPRQVLTAPELEMLPTEVFTAAGKKELGIDPLQIEQIVAIVESTQEMMPAAGVVLHMAGPLEPGKILAPLWDQGADAQLDGKPYRQGSGPLGFSIFRPDDRTVLIATDALLKKMLSNHASPKEGRMTKVLGHVSDPPDAMAILLIEPIRALLTMSLPMVPLSPEFDDAKKLPELLTSIGAKVNLTGDKVMSFTLRANDEAAAKQVEEILDKLLAGAQQSATAQIAAQQPVGNDPVAQASAQYSKRITERMLKAIRPVRSGMILTVSNSGSGSSLMMSMAGMSAMSFFAMRAQAINGMGGAGGMPGVPGAAAPGVPGAAMPGVPGVAMPSAPGAAMPGVPGVAMPSAPGAAMPGAPGQAMPSAPGAAMPGPGIVPQKPAGQQPAPSAPAKP